MNTNLIFILTSQSTADLSEINEGLPVTELEILRAKVTDLVDDLSDANKKVAILEKDLTEKNEKVIILEDLLKAANETISSTEARLYSTETKLKEVIDEQDKSEEEKVVLMRQLHQASSVAVKIKHDDKQTHFFTGLLPSYDVFVVLLTHLSPLVAKEKSFGSGLTLDDELLVTLVNARESIDQSSNHILI